MNVDIIKRSSQNIMVNVDLFSKFVTTCFIESEQAKDLENGIIALSSPIRHSKEVLIRVDKAKGFVSLVRTKPQSLSELGITLELTNDENKNANCRVPTMLTI